MKHLILVVLAVAACGKAKHADGVACDAKAVGDLATSLDLASGMNVDLTSDKVKADIEKAKAAVIGKTFAFIGCKFDGQGNDKVDFASSDGSKTVHCVMKDGEKGVTEFRHAAMKIGEAKLKLDVSGKIAATGSKDFPRIGMTDCEISAHE